MIGLFLVDTELIEKFQANNRAWLCRWDGVLFGTAEWNVIGAWIRATLIQCGGQEISSQISRVAHC